MRPRPGDNGAGPDPNNPLQNPKCSNGSIVECENQVLGEALPIVGTPYSLNYRSDRVPGLIASRNIRLSGASVPASLASIDLHVAVAGQTFDQTFPAAANQQMTFVWDRRDAYGREVVGGQTLSVKIDYNYPTTYKEPGPFPAGFNSVGLVSLNANPMRQQINLSQSFTTTIGEGLTDARTIGLGGWTLSAHHVYDPNARVAHLGSGSRRRAGSLARTLTTVPVPGQTVLFDVEVAPDGSQLVALPHGDQIIRVATRRRGQRRGRQRHRRLQRRRWAGDASDAGRSDRHRVSAGRQPLHCRAGQLQGAQSLARGNHLHGCRDWNSRFQRRRRSGDAGATVVRGACCRRS